MPRFFVDNIQGSTHTITGNDARHISKSLRMKVGESITLCNKQGTDYDCTISEFVEDSVVVHIENQTKCISEPNTIVTLYQGIPKGEKMDLIVQKSVELGINKIVPVIMSRCISRPDQKSSRKKVDRWQKIAEEAAKQSRRGIIPKVCEPIELDYAINDAKSSDIVLAFYESGGDKLKNLVGQNAKSVSIFIGPEGGFEEHEINSILNSGGVCATLGNRILRTETAPLAAISIIMHITGNI